ncbi:pyridoxamine 5'-phosphate oxidase [Roseicyclus mahoneyensis]|uniref:Pyridoxamine 5'-phosphate oxidase-like protein n=1 Tax=Roseicyclus mahoneyensis TaxID=164332 RepID=A0A316GLP2_9RHOB|nr:pyridoxamine 5'-phosphate oxidase [Roseicyclus mahoneyensis]PWK61627.1 pyridoxamine 5'-phosphate oxidase-like protein [Roseicyclus mahoneyensis]
MTEETLTGLLDTIWQHLARGTADRHHPARHPTLASIGTDGPELRTLVLRRAERSGALLEVHTDAASPKAVQIVADPRVALHVWLPKPRLQIRARAMALLEPGDPAVFANLPPEAQANYGGPVPGTPLPGPAKRAAGDPARFTRILCHLTEVDALLLSDPHRRARYRADGNWQGQWIVP